MRIAVVAVLVNILLSVLLVDSMQHTGLALAVSIAAWVNALLLLIMLMVRGIYRPQPGWLWFLARIALAVLAMSVALIWLNQPPAVWHAWSLTQRIGHLILLVGSGVVIYFAVLLVFGIRPKQLLLGSRAASPSDTGASEN
jgi:putative peptidoglycan lipid II flippase